MDRPEKQIDKKACITGKINVAEIMQQEPNPPQQRAPEVESFSKISVEKTMEVQIPKQVKTTPQEHQAGIVQEEALEPVESAELAKAAAVQDPVAEKIELDVQKESDEDEEESPVHIILDFLSTFLVALIVLIAGILVIGQLAGFHLFNVASGSMTPTYPVNSLVIVRDVDPETIEEGDVITFVMNEDGMLVTHRVVSVDTSEKTFRTKGDANNVEDAEPVIWGNVVGKVMFGIPAVGGPFAVMTAKEHRKIMIGIILGLLLLSIWWDGNKKKRKNKEGEANE